MPKHLLHRIDYIFYIQIIHPMEHGQGYKALISRLCNRILPAAIAEALTVKGMGMNGDVVDVYAYVLRPQSGKDLCPSDTKI